ncbi:MAG: M48 family metallopeptidase [Legionella sp.]|nr:M48 family metallopeptidase [Legionella sp.]
MDTDAPCITFGTDRIPFELREKRQESACITVKVMPDCQVIVLAPPSASSDEIICAVNKRARWVYNKLKIFKEQQEQISFRQYLSGESYYYLGKQYVLKVIDDPETTSQVKLLRGQLQVIKNKQEHQAQLLILAWYKQRAYEIFNQRLDVLLPEVHWVKSRPVLKIKQMKSRWGSCSSKGKITLNTHLIKAPVACIDYVILHELCHIAEHNHSHKFYRLLNAVSPNWKQTKSYLDRSATRYLTA